MSVYSTERELDQVTGHSIEVFLAWQHHGAADLCRFCEGFFLQNMERLLDREDFHRLLSGGVAQELLCSQARLLTDLEAALIRRLCSLHSACRE